MTENNMSREIVLQWLDAVQRTARALDHEAHMDLVSRRVQVHGIPGFEVIGYEDWARQCEHEFKEGLLKSVGYEGLRMTVSTDTRIMFQTRERVEATDGTVVRHGLEVLLEKEADGKWRVVRERIMPDDEAVYSGLLDVEPGRAP
jgi:ketosteroid isomerase-like protein